MYRANEYLFLRSWLSALHHVRGITSGIWLLWHLLTSAPSPIKLPWLAQWHLFCCCCPLFVSHQPSTTAGDVWPWWPCRPAGSYYKRDSVLVKQISPDKSMNFHYTTAAFTPIFRILGFVTLCWLTQSPGLICYFCSSAHSFALQPPSDGAKGSRKNNFTIRGVTIPV